jgi:hypothetical protein
MKKIALAVLLASGLMAADNGVYVGADVGNTFIRSEASYLGDTEKFSDDGFSQTLKLGYYLNKNSRVLAFYQNVNTDGGDTFFYGAGYDYLIGNEAMKPFIGVMAGYGSQKDDEGIADISGAIYGIQVGFNYAFNENFSAEGGFRYIKSSMEDTATVYDEDIKVEINNITNIFFGVNYKF